MMAKKPESASPAGKVRLLVRTTAAHGDAPRYRAGLGPFRREPVEVEATPEQAAELKADPALAVAEVGA